MKLRFVYRILSYFSLLICYCTNSIGNGSFIGIYSKYGQKDGRLGSETSLSVLEWRRACSTFYHAYTQLLEIEGADQDLHGGYLLVDTRLLVLD